MLGGNGSIQTNAGDAHARCPVQTLLPQLARQSLPAMVRADGQLVQPGTMCAEGNGGECLNGCRRRMRHGECGQKFALRIVDHPALSGTGALQGGINILVNRCEIQPLCA